MLADAHISSLGYLWLKVLHLVLNLRPRTVDSGALTIYMENPQIPERIRMERFIPGEIFRKKGNTFRDITFFPFLPKWPKFSLPFVWITSARLHVERKWKICRNFINGTTQSRCCFRCQTNTCNIRQKFFTEISVQMVSVPDLRWK